MIIATVKYEGYKKFKLHMTREEFEKEYVERHRSIEQDANAFEDRLDEWVTEVIEVEDDGTAVRLYA